MFQPLTTWIAIHSPKRSCCQWNTILFKVLDLRHPDAIASISNETYHMWWHDIITGELLSENVRQYGPWWEVPSHNSSCNMSSQNEAHTDVKVGYLVNFEVKASINYPSHLSTKTPRRLVAMASFLSERSYFPKNQRSGCRTQAPFFESDG